MSDKTESKVQTYRIRFRNDHNNELGLWIEPLGMHIPILPKTLIEVVFTQNENAELTITFDEDSNVTLDIMSQAYVYQDNELIYPDWEDPNKNKE